MHEPIPHLSDYEVSGLNGFLPNEPPCDRLPDDYRQWESVIHQLPQMIISNRLRPYIDTMPTLNTRGLTSLRQWRRAYSLLSMMAHAYVWGGQRSVERVPQSISIPFLTVCQRLELPPVATYAGLVQWNWRPFETQNPIDNVENIMTLQTFTGSFDEQWFYLISMVIEVRGAPVIPLMLQAISATRNKDGETVAACLRTFAERLDDLASTLVRMSEWCDPAIFYNRIRPFLAGSKNMEDAGLPNGVLFDTGSPDDHYVQFSGASSAQSPIIQFFDIILGIEHRPTGVRSPTTAYSYTSASQAEGPPTTPKLNFIRDMRQYMPGSHRRFLEHVERVAIIRSYVETNRNELALVTAFNTCLAMLRAFRDKHINIVSRYIIVKAHENALSHYTEPSTTKPVNIASTNSGPHRLLGTGGSALIPFLKQARDETGEPAIND